ncbi:HAMP domain-containing sensor histidine kinase [Herpetosiphon gulosus]|uniref:histidine kinase n=1 Tax=Herpetosiphon gulosus TaxID=1973496 RepID=A0ABP9X1K2_9CHLR
MLKMIINSTQNHAEPATLQHYQKLLEHNKRRLIQLITLVACGLAIPFTLILGLAVLNQQQSLSIFSLHLVRSLFNPLLVWWLVRRKQINWAWHCTMLLAIGYNSALAYAMHLPNVIIFELFALCSFAVVMPFWQVLAYTSGLIGLNYLVAGQFIVLNEWALVMIMVLSIVLMCSTIGFVSRQTLWHASQQHSQTAQLVQQRSSMQQQLHDLQSHVQQLSLLKHDLRQPLKSVQGLLQGLAFEQPSTNSTIQPALAATQRVERQLNNLLDQARQQLGRQRASLEIIDVQQCLAQLQPAISGLAAYYSEPIAKVQLEIAAGSVIMADREQFERALFNLLDNSLSRCHHEVRISSYRSEQNVIIEVRDDGAGMHQALRAALNQADFSAITQGLGLKQVQQMLNQAKATLYVPDVPTGYTIQLHFPQVTQ